MNDKNDNVVQFRPHAVRDSRAAIHDAAGQQRRREREEAVIARASEIKEWVSGFRRRLPLEQRIQLATHLGRMLYLDARLKRGDLTEILVAAGISRPEENTKRLPRFATRPGRDVPSPKLLAAKPAGYLAIVEALARRSGSDEDKAVCDLFAEVIPSVTADQHENSKGDVADFVPLYRLILAVADGAIKEGPFAGYFHHLARHRWIPAIDVLSRDVPDGPFGPLWLELCSEEPPEVSGIWLLDINEFAMDPNDLEFFEERMSLLPKVPIYREDYAWFHLDVPSTYTKFWFGREPAPDFDLQEIDVGLELLLWLVIAPSGPTHVPTPYLARFARTRVSGQCMVSNEPLMFETYSAPAQLVFRDFSNGELEIGFSPLESMQINFNFRLQEARPEPSGLENTFIMEIFNHVFRCDAPYGSPDNRPRLLPITPSSIAKELGVPRPLGSDVEQISGFSAAPFRTSGSVVETVLRSPLGKDLQNELIESVRSLAMEEERAGERLRTARADQLEDTLNRLSNASTQE